MVCNMFTHSMDNHRLHTEPEPCRKTDAVFHFAQIGEISPDSLSMQYVETNDHLTVASHRFAEQMDAEAIKEQNSYMDNGFNKTAEMTNLFMQSTKLAEEHNFDQIINIYLTFAQKSNILPRNVVDGFKRSIISSLKVVSTDTICRELNFDLPQEGLQQIERRTENVYGDYTEWEKILEVLSFDEESVCEYLLTTDSDFGLERPTIKFVLTILDQVGLEHISMSDKLKIYLLTNIKNLSSLVAMKAFLIELMPATFNSSETANNFIAAMADTPRFEHSVFTNDLIWFMGNVNISDEFCAKCMFFMDTKDSMLQWSLREGTKQHGIRGRVRLRYRVGAQQTDASLASGVPIIGGGLSIDNSNGYTHEQNTYTSTSASNMSQMQEDSLQGWVMRARVPPAVLHKSKLLGYLLMSQTAFADPGNAIRTHFAHDSEIADNMLRNEIYKPQVSVLVEFLRLLTIRVTPFEELKAFRTECFTDFSYTDSKDLSWIKFLQLYIACYQNEDIWPQVWKTFCSVLSHQVLLAVSNFKSRHKYAIDKVAHLCIQDDESTRKIVYDVN